MSELDRIGRLVDRFGRESLIVPSGDDAAVARPRGAVSVTSIDAVVDGKHFQRAVWPPHAIGFKAVGAALSDLAAMGASAGEIYVAAGVPRDLDEAAFDDLTRGIAEASAAAGAVVAGGDLVAAEELWLSVTVVGYAESADAVLTRSGAAAGDLVAVTGTLGGSARALEQIEQGASTEDASTKKQFAPEPRIAAGAALAACGASAMIDISDGLGRDAGHVGASSGVLLEIELARIPLAGGVTDAAYAAASGEEYELLATIPEDRLAGAERAVTETGVALTVIGRVTEGSGARLVDAAGAEVVVGGFDHFD